MIDLDLKRSRKNIIYHKEAGMYTRIAYEWFYDLEYNIDILIKLNYIEWKDENKNMNI